MTSRYIPSIATQSLGRAWHHTLEDKLRACARHGFKAIELFMEDLHYVAKSLPHQHPAQPAGTSFTNSSEWQEQQLAAADYIHRLCQELKLAIICIQPFMHYDGLIDRDEHKQRIEELHFWIMLADRLDTDLIQVPSSFLPDTQCTADPSQIIADLREAADIGLQHTPVIRFAYEALCWGTHINKWDDAWDIIRTVDRPNFGTCLDTFNIAGRVYADPTSPTGRNATADADIRASIHRLIHDLDISKVFYVEVVDGERLDTPLTASHPWYDPAQSARMTWSRNARLFPFEARGYLPILEIFDAILDRGFTGYVSFEFFSRTANVAGEGVPESLAIRGEVSWRKLMAHVREREQTQLRFGKPRSITTVTKTNPVAKQWVQARTIERSGRHASAPIIESPRILVS